MRQAEPPPGESPDLPTAGDPARPSADYAGQSPPEPYPRRRSKRRLIIGVLVAVALVAAMTVAIVYGVRTNGANTGTSFSEGAAKAAIQEYLNALERRDIDVIVRDALCGMYDGVHDKRSDQALAKMTSDGFRKQFAEVELTSIDKIVYLSPYQARALFTMRVLPTTPGLPRTDVQAVAELLFQRGQTMVCSYMPRSGGSY
jgi:hypothetical protein